MDSTAARCRASVTGSLIRLILAAAVGVAVLAGATGESGATSLVIVQAQGGPGNGAIARLANDNQSVVSRSVGLMVGAAADPSGMALGDTRAVVSRSVGLMQGAAADPREVALGDTTIEVSRSVGLMDGARG